MKKLALILALATFGMSLAKSQSSRQPARDTLHRDSIVQGKALGNVSVVSQKGFVEQKIDRMVVNVNSLISNAGTNALEVLQKVPGVQVDEDGNITFKGKSGVLVMIDDKPTYLSAADLATWLRSISSAQLDKIELMDNPPARYDAAGNAGAINIRTKKSETRGFNGTATGNLTQGYYFRPGGSLSINYRNRRLNIFGSLAYDHRKQHRQLDITRDFLDASGNSSSLFRQTSRFIYSNEAFSSSAGADYNLTPATTIGILLSYQWSPNSYSSSDPVTRAYNSAGLPDSSIQAENFSIDKFRREGVNLNFRHEGGQARGTLSGDLDYIRFSTENDQTFANSVYYPNGSLKASQFTSANLPVGIDIFAGKTDYSLPLPGKVKLEAGLKSSYVATDNAANYFNVAGGMTTVDYDHTNRFLYKENINAAYFNFNKDWSRISVQAGLRAENTNSTGHQLGNAQKPDSSFSNHYTDLFPTAYLSWKLDTAGAQSLTASYGRRIGRPNYRNLNPFIFIVDKFTQFAGNPFLRPQFSDNYLLAWRYRNSLTVTAQYQHVSDIQIETIYNKGPIFVSTTGNLGKQDYFNLNANWTVKPQKWWALNLYGELGNFRYSSALNGGVLEVNSTYFYFNGSSQFTLGRGWSAELSGFYNTPQQNGQFDKIAFGQLNAGLQKKAFANKATFKLNIRDILHSYTSAGNIVNVPGTLITYHNTFDSQVVTLAVSWNFGSLKTEERRKTGSADSEAQRAN